MILSKLTKKRYLFPLAFFAGFLAAFMTDVIRWVIG